MCKRVENLQLVSDLQNSFPFTSGHFRSVELKEDGQVSLKKGEKFFRFSSFVILCPSGDLL